MASGFKKESKYSELQSVTLPTAVYGRKENNSIAIHTYLCLYYFKNSLCIE